MPTHQVTVTPPGGGAPVDFTCWVDTISIQHGRDDPLGQPEASSCTIDFTVTPADGPLPAAVDVGATIQVVTTVAAVGFTRFVGRLTDLALGWDDAGENTPDAGLGTLVAMGILADLGRRVVGDAPWPQELDGARVFRVMAAAGITLSGVTSDPGTVQIIARDIDQQPALDVAHDAAQSAGGMVWQTRTGEVRYADANHRKGIASSLTMDACDILITPTWRRTTDGLINEVSIGYGASSGDQPRYVATDPASIAARGRYGYSATTALAALGDASALGQMLLVRNSQPVWVMSSLPVDLKGLDDARYQALLGLEMHSLITLTGLPSISTAPTSAVLWVEGWTERLAWDGDEIELNVSGYCRTVPAPQWDQTDPAWTWNTITPASLTWDQTTCMGPPAYFGRWNDQAASLRWNQVPPATTWDTYS